MRKLLVFLCAMVLILGMVGMASAYPMNGLVAGYSFSGDAQDVSGNGNHGTVHGTVTLTEDRFGNTDSAYRFNGTYGQYDISGDYIEVAHSSNLNFGISDFSISFWVNSESSTYQSIFSKGFLTDQGSYWLRLNDIKNPPGFISFLTSELYRTNTHLPSDIVNVTDGLWHHIVAMRKSNDVLLYLDGTFLDSISGPIRNIDSENPLYFGAFRDGNNNIEKVTDGVIDDIFIYNHALSADNITDLFNSPNPIPEPATMLLLGTGLIGLAGFRRKLRKT